MDLVVDHVAELEDVRSTHGDGALECFTRTTIIERGFALLIELWNKSGVHLLAVSAHGFVDHIDIGASDGVLYLDIGVET